MQIVGQKDVVRQLLVASDLIGFQNLVEVFANGLVLDVAKDHRRLLDFEIRRAEVAYFFRLVDDANTGIGLMSRRIQESFERAPVRMLGFVVAVLP
ncbi:MAG: hypothetical protein M3178_08780 [Pseudomonadota bacterium]|nr:hypothetical protein [Pseudomonadota bacterium]